MKFKKDPWAESGLKKLLISPRRAYFPRNISDATKNLGEKRIISLKDKPKEYKLEFMN